MNTKTVNQVSADRKNTYELMDIDTEDIAAVLCKLAFPDESAGELEEEIEEALYNLKCTAENPYNDDCYRILIQALANIAEYQQY